MRRDTRSPSLRWRASGGISHHVARASPGARRRDFLIYAGNKPVFSCEVEVPTTPAGASPYDAKVVKDARSKAEAEGLDYFGTMNCASFVLWQVHMPGVPVSHRSLDRWRVVEPENLTRLDLALAQAIRDLREERGLSQEEWASAQVCTGNYVGGCERGEINLSFAVMLQLTRARRQLSRPARRYERRTATPPGAGLRKPAPGVASELR